MPRSIKPSVKNAISLLFRISGHSGSHHPKLFSDKPAVIAQSLIPSSSIGRFPIKPSRICRSCTANTRAAISLGLPVIFTVTLFSPFISLSPGSPPGLFHAFFFGSDLPNVVYLYNFCSIFLQIEQIAAQHLILNCKSSILSFAINFFICSSLKGMVLKCQTILLLLSLFLIA